MAQMMGAVADELVAFECTEPLSGVVRGSGTAFWAEVEGQRKLLTAGHIPWPQLLTYPPDHAPDNEVLRVVWATVSNKRGDGEAIFHAHPLGSTLDYAVIEFLDDANKPPGQSFQIDPFLPANADLVTAVGFPGTFYAGAPPIVARANGSVAQVCILEPITEIMVAGSAGPGYSGGPASRTLDNGLLHECVVGLMRGRPFQTKIDDMGLKDAFVLFASVSFR
jgi:hypothetical protein